MQTHRRLYAVCLFFTAFVVFSQEGYFSNPVKIPLYLAGNFGEVRPNHFHAGIDIKTMHREGIEVYASAEGYVSRIKISPFGYGKALYITHPNGYTSVYGHLQRFAPRLEQLVKYHQYKKNTYEIDIEFNQTDLTILKDELVAYSGNTGGSAGPHLHFEIRNTKTGDAENPANFGFSIKDLSPPVIERLYVYPMDSNSLAAGKNEPSPVNIKLQKDGSWLADTVTAEGVIGFGISCFDRQDGTANKNACYSVFLKVNGMPHLAYKFDRISFETSKYVNVFIDYERYRRQGVKIQKCFTSERNLLRIYDEKSNNGNILIEDGLSYSVQIEAKDIAGNAVTLNIPVEGKHVDVQPVIPKTEDGHQILTTKDYYFNLGGSSLYFPPDTFYEDTVVQIKDTLQKVEVTNRTSAIKTPYTIKFDISDQDESERSKLFVSRVVANKDTYEYTYLIGDAMLACRTGKTGVFRVAKDIVPPTVTPLGFRNGRHPGLSVKNTVSFRIHDDRTGIKSYNAYINKQWFLMEYEPKTQTITGNLEDLVFDTSELEFLLVVEDRVGNTNTYKTIITNKK